MIIRDRYEKGPSRLQLYMDIRNSIFNIIPRGYSYSVLLTSPPLTKANPNGDRIKNMKCGMAGDYHLASGPKQAPLRTIRPYRPHTSPESPHPLRIPDKSTSTCRTPTRSGRELSYCKQIIPGKQSLWCSISSIISTKRVKSVTSFSLMVPI